MRSSQPATTCGLCLVICADRMSDGWTTVGWAVETSGGGGEVTEDKSKEVEILGMMLEWGLPYLRDGYWLVDGRLGGRVLSRGQGQMARTSDEVGVVTMSAKADVAKLAEVQVVSGHNVLEVRKELLWITSTSRLWGSGRNVSRRE